MKYQISINILKNIKRLLYVNFDMKNTYILKKGGKNNGV